MNWEISGHETEPTGKQASWFETAYQLRLKDEFVFRKPWLLLLLMGGGELMT